MKRIFRYSLIAMVAVGLSLSSCKKNDSTEVDDTAEQQQMAADEANQNTETESSMNEANDAIGTTGFGKAGAITGATVTIDSGLKKITVNYDGNNKNSSRYRKGEITIQLTNGSRWKDVGAKITITYNAFKVTRNSTGKSLVFNGIIDVVNVNGGRVFLDSNVVHLATSTDFKVTFDDGTQKSWNLSRKRTFITGGGTLSVKTEGTGSAGGNSNLITWGQNRKGDMFYTQISTPIIYNTILSVKCPDMVLSGVKTHKGLSREITATFGVDMSGNPYVGNDCPYGFKITWTNAAGKSKQAVISY